MDYMQELYELCDTITNEIAEANEKIKAAGGKLTAGDLDYIDKLTHSLKSIKGVEHMEDSGYSSRPYMEGSFRGNSREGGSYRGGSYRGGSYRGGSYARGRSNAGRGGSSRYSGDDGMVEELQELMQDAPNDAVRRDIQRLIEKVEQM